MKTHVPAVVAALVLCLAFSAAAELRAGPPNEDTTSSSPPATSPKRATADTRPVARGVRASASASGSMSGSASGGAFGGGQSAGNGGVMNGSHSGVSGTMKMRVALSTDGEDVEQPDQPYAPGGLGAADASPDDASVTSRMDGGRRITTIEREGETITITDSPSRIVVHRLDRTVEPPASRYVAVTTPRALQAKDPAAHALYERYVVRRAAAVPAGDVANPRMGRLLDDILANAP